jgi:hypothetical protein
MTFVNRCVYWSSTYLRVYDLCILRVRSCVRLKLFIVVHSVGMRRNAVLEDRDCGSQARSPSGLYNSFVTSCTVSYSPAVRHDPHNTSWTCQLHKLHLQSALPHSRSLLRLKLTFSCQLNSTLMACPPPSAPPKLRPPTCVNPDC